VLGRLRGLLAALAVLWAAPALAAPPQLSAIIRSEWALGLEDGRSQNLDAVFEPRLDWELGGGWLLHAVGRLRADAFDRLEPGEPQQPELAWPTKLGNLGSHATAELRELTLEKSIGRAFFRIGKQQIVWGTSDGLKVLDRVDPQSFREFILPPFDQSRIPLWAASAELPVGPATLQLVWQPDTSVDKIPDPDWLFAFTAPRYLPALLPGTIPIVENPERPKPFGLAGDAGARLSTFAGGFDLSLVYLWQYDDRPIFFGDRTNTPFGPAVVYHPRYRRTHLVGGTFSTALGDFTLRGELAYQSDRYLGTKDPTSTDLVTRTPELLGVIGVDYFGIRDTMLSLQVFESWLVRDARGLLRDRSDTIVTFYARHTLWNDRLELSSIWLQDVNQGDGLVRPKVSYELRSGWKLWAGVDVFYGSARGSFGEFDGNSRFLLGMELGIP
jgi:hypothetical protein